MIKSLKEVLKMNQKQTLLALVISASTLASATVNAELVAKDWASIGDELLSFDTNSGLNWLDLSMTLGNSYNDVEIRLSSDLAGWRLPNKAEVESLFESAFSGQLSYNADGSVWVYESGDTLSSASYSDGEHFASLFGNYGLNNTKYAYGLYKDDIGTIRMMGAYLNADDGARIYSADYNNTYEHLADAGHLQFGTLLVANDMNLPEAPPELVSAPVSASFGLFAIAMAGFGFRRKENQ